MHRRELFICLGGVTIAAFIWWLCMRKQKPSLYTRLGGVYAISMVVDRFSDKILDNPLVGRESPNPYLREWSNNHLDRLPGLKFMRTLWVCSVAGGPYTYVPTKQGGCPYSSLCDQNFVSGCPFSLDNAHRDLHITDEEFQAVATELKDAMTYYGVGPEEQKEVLAAFSAHKLEVVS